MGIGFRQNVDWRMEFEQNLFWEMAHPPLPKNLLIEVWKSKISYFGVAIGNLG